MVLQDNETMKFDYITIAKIMERSKLKDTDKLLIITDPDNKEKAEKIMTTAEALRRGTEILEGDVKKWANTLPGKIKTKISGADVIFVAADIELKKMKSLSRIRKRKSGFSEVQDIINPKTNKKTIENFD